MLIYCSKLYSYHFIGMGVWWVFLLPCRSPGGSPTASVLQPAQFLPQSTALMLSIMLAAVTEGAWERAALYQGSRMRLCSVAVAPLCPPCHTLSVPDILVFPCRRKGNTELISFGSAQEKTLLMLIIPGGREQLKVAKRMCSMVILSGKWGWWNRSCLWHRLGSVWVLCHLCLGMLSGAKLCRKQPDPGVRTGAALAEPKRVGFAAPFLPLCSIHRVRNRLRV